MIEKELIEYIEDRQRQLRKVSVPDVSIAMQYELNRLKRYMGIITDYDIEGWLLIYCKHTGVPVGELIQAVATQTGAERDRIVNCMWDLVDDDKLEYGADAVVRTK
jgi:hypothetical protein